MRTVPDAFSNGSEVDNIRPDSLSKAPNDAVLPDNDAVDMDVLPYGSIQCHCMFDLHFYV